jgi:hypothetical protein
LQRIDQVLCHLVCLLPVAEHGTFWRMYTSLTLLSVNFVQEEKANWV